MGTAFTPTQIQVQKRFLKQKPTVRPTSCLTSRVIIIGRHWDDIGLTAS
jgi:hypothetical protein